MTNEVILGMKKKCLHNFSYESQRNLGWQC